MAIDLVQNVTNDSILFTVLIYKIYDNNDSVLDDLKSFSENFVSQEQVTFLRDLSQNLIQKKVYFNRKVFREQMIIFNNIKCKTNCPVETFSNYKENSKSNYNNSINSIKINRIVCILLFLILIIFIKYLYIRI